MAEVCIVAAARTAQGRRRGWLSSWHPAGLVAETLNAVADFSQFRGAEMIARKYGFDCEQLDAIALEGHRRAAAATQAGAFAAEIVPMMVQTSDGPEKHVREDALQACGLRYGLRTMCEGGGIANATIIERL